MITRGNTSGTGAAAAAATHSGYGGGDKSGQNTTRAGQQSQGQQQQQQQTEHSASMAGSGISMASVMSPLGIGMEGLTEQQTAEVVELLTPFMSPAATPAFNAANGMQQVLLNHPATPLALGQAGLAPSNNMLATATDHRRRTEDANAFSPLTSPALVPQPGAGRAGVFAFGMPMGDGSALRAQHQQQQYISANGNTMAGAVSMPPPSPSITAGHMLRRQQQMLLEKYQQQQGSPLFSAGSPMFTYSPSVSGVGRMGVPGAAVSGRSRRNTGASANTTASPHHHPYRNGPAVAATAASQAGKNNSARVTASGRPGDTDEFQLDALSDQNFAAAMAASLHNTPVQLPLQASGITGIAGLDLPDAMASTSAAALGIPTATSAADLDHQLAASLASSAKDRTLHQLNPHGRQLPGAQDTTSHAALTVAQQLDRWLGPAHQLDSSNTGDTVTVPQGQHPGAAVTATPASLMNLPLSAHHLPHTSTGEIISPAPHIQQQAADKAMQQQQQTDRVIAATLAELTRSIPISTPLLNFATQSAPMGELMHPPVPPPLQIGPSSEAAAACRNKRVRRKSVSSTLLTEPVVRVRRSGAGDSSARGRRRSRMTPLISPRPTPLVPSTLKGLSPGMSPQTGPLVSPALPPLNPAPMQRSSIKETTPGSTTATPQMRPRPVVAATSTTNIVGLEADVVTRLATKSNYQNIMEGNSEFLGLKYHKEFKTGLERRRTNHKQAEQKRRDSLKQCFDQLKDKLEDLDPKLVSKIYLLKKANVLIDSLRRSNELLASAAREKGVDVDALLATNVPEEIEEDGESAPEDDDDGV
ncbi:hypothetical protein GGF39_002739 [Coemansia sp. RSA 1721]|nr:hypothetical protein GGF39_002739 [Coemansia sp. RSA 1721]